MSHVHLLSSCHISFLHLLSLSYLSHLIPTSIFSFPYATPPSFLSRLIPTSLLSFLPVTPNSYLSHLIPTYHTLFLPATVYLKSAYCTPFPFAPIYLPTFINHYYSPNFWQGNSTLVLVTNGTPLHPPLGYTSIHGPSTWQ